MTKDITSMESIVNLIVSGEDITKFGNINVKYNGALALLNYNQFAQYEGTWNYLERVSRGLVINTETGEIVARPFDKFFNWLEGGRKASGHMVTIMEKLDGSCGILLRNNGYQIITRGSFDSEQAIWATNFLNKNYDLRGLPDELTLMFEIIYPENRIVLDYAGREDLVLLAARNRHTGEYLPFYPDLYDLGEQFGFNLPKTYSFNNVGEILAQTGIIEDEGYVVEFSDGQRFKFKGDRYLEIHRMINGLSYKNTVIAHRDGLVDTIFETVPDEFLGEFEGWLNEIESHIHGIEHKVEKEFAVAPKGSRKEFALWVIENNSDIRQYLFARLDEKPIRPLIYDNLLKN